MSSLKISTKIVITLAIAILGMAIIGLTSYFGVSKVGKELVQIADYQMPIKNATIELEKDILKEEILAYALFAESSDKNSAKFKKIVDEIHEFEEKTEKAIIEAEKLVQKAIDHADTQKAKKSYKHFMDELKVLEKEQKKVKGLFKLLLEELDSGDMYKFKKDKNELIEELKLMDKNINILLTELTVLLADSAQTAKSDEELVLIIIEIVSVISLIVSIISAILLIKFFNRSMTNFQGGLKGFFKYLNHETTDVKPIDLKNKEDEIGQMAESVNRNIVKAKNTINEDKDFIDSVKKVVDEVKKGTLTSKLELNTTNENLNELKDSFNEMMSVLEQNIGTNTNTILDILDKLANYDFDCNISGAKGKIEVSLNSVIDLINIMLNENKANGLALDSSAKDLLGNVDKLSRSSNEAAASLEETAAALEEITSTVQVTTSKVSEMSNLAEEVTAATTKGEKLADNTTNAMEEINTQVSTINEAITVIDQIAFQTNILSLNAAVEAATAGEAGKGFAVVAAEVRNLAARSAEAAKEIKDIVELANAKANEGKNIANEMSNGYAELNENISKTIELIKDVTTASREQQGGLEQVNGAVNLLDRQTQENAMIATQTQEISSQTSSIAKEVLDDVEKKNFKGKNSVTAKKIETSTLNTQNDFSEVTIEKAEVKTATKKETPQKETNNKPKEIVSQSGDDEWESF